MLEEKYNQALEKHRTKYDFLNMMYIFDYVYVTDLMGYVENQNKEKILSGEKLVRHIEYMIMLEAKHYHLLSKKGI